VAHAARCRAPIRLGAIGAASVAGALAVLFGVAPLRPVQAQVQVTASTSASATATGTAGGAGPVVGSAVRGAEADEARCIACHSVTTDRIGPRHAGIVGRRAGSVTGFEYSPALARSGLVWNADLLDRWLRNPEDVVPGQRMGFRLGDPQIRADIVAYLATLQAPAP
jgi:cytochrome c